MPSNDPKGFGRESSQCAAYQTLVNGRNFTYKSNTFFNKTCAFLVVAYYQIIFAFVDRTSLGSNSDNNRVLTGFIKRVGRYNYSGTLLKGGEISKRKRHQHYLSSLITGHRPSLGRCSKNQTTVPRGAIKLCPRHGDLLALANGQGAGAAAQAERPQLPVLFGRVKGFAYASSISNGVFVSMISFFLLASGYALVASPLVASASVVVGQSNTTSLSQGLVGYWTLDGSKTNWLTGTTQDSSGLGNTGQLIGMSTTTSPTQGKVGQALGFNGGNYINAAASGLVTNGAAFTISIWFKTTAVAQVLYQESNTGNNSPLGGITMNSDGTLFGNIRDNSVVSGNTGFTTAAYNDGKWHQAVLIQTSNPAGLCMLTEPSKLQGL